MKALIGFKAFYFFGSVSVRFGLYLVIMKAIDGLSSETILQLFYKHNTVDYRLLWDNTQCDYKDHELNAVTWNNLYFEGISAI